MQTPAPTDGQATVRIDSGNLGQAILSGAVFGLIGAAAGRVLAKAGEGRFAAGLGRKVSAVVFGVFSGSIAFYSSLRSTAEENARNDAQNSAAPNGQALAAQKIELQTTPNGQLQTPDATVIAAAAQYDGAVQDVARATQR
ncbi:MAG: hypothetical protein DI582_09950 [Azospirillum brasilense]|nr:MAG: hypothetical protein DI582_09950 [Azospirillum brasilense]